VFNGILIKRELGANLEKIGDIGKNREKGGNR
jgi:hypothetical protein